MIGTLISKFKEKLWDIDINNLTVSHLENKACIMNGFAIVGIIVLGDPTGCRTGNREKLSSSQSVPGQAIKSAVAQFPSISCATSCLVTLYGEVCGC